MKANSLTLPGSPRSPIFELPASLVSRQPRPPSIIVPASPNHPVSPPIAPIFKNLRVTDSDTCASFLPDILKKYRLPTSLHEYSLVLAKTDSERVLQLTEKPPALFAEAAKRGQHPTIMPRKLGGWRGGGRGSCGGFCVLATAVCFTN